MLVLCVRAAGRVVVEASTMRMPLDVSVALTGAVRRGAPRTYVMGDMPFLSYHGSVDRALENAGRYFTEAYADCVKLEVDGSHLGVVEKMAGAGMAVCAHLGSRPQSVKQTGGYVAAGRDADGAARIVEDARAMEEAGAVMLLLEAVPHEVAERVVDAVGVPVIGIGAGPSVHGQILVVNDLIGLTDRPPVFAPRVGEVGEAIRRAGEQWVEMVRARSVSEHRIRMHAEAESSR